MNAGRNERRECRKVRKQARRGAAREKDVDLTQEDPGAVLVLGVPGHLICHPKLDLTLIQFVDQLHFS